MVSVSTILGAVSLAFVTPFILAFVLGQFQFLIALCIEDRVVRTLLLLPLPGLTAMAGCAFFYQFLHLRPSFLGPFFSDEFVLFLWTVVILLGILIGGGMGSHARRKR